MIINGQWTTKKGIPEEGNNKNIKVNKYTVNEEIDDMKGGKKIWPRTEKKRKLLCGKN